MRLLLVIDNLGWGGAQRQLANLAAGLARRGHEVAIFVYQPEFDHVVPLVREAGVRIIAVEKRHKLDLDVVRRLAATVREEGFQALVAFLRTPSSYASIAGWRTGVPAVVSERSFFEGRIGPIERLRRQTHRLAAHVTTNAHHTRERMERAFPWLRDRISTIWNGVDTEAYRPRPEDRCGPEPGRLLRLLGVGSVVPGKEIERVAGALALACRQGAPFEVSWAGQIYEARDSQAIVREVDARLEEAGARDRWHWLGLRHDVAELHGQHDAVVHPSYLEGLPNALCEAIASGRPVVASKAADHPRLVGADGDRGFLFEGGDASSLAEAIARLAATDSDERAALSRRGRAFAERELSLSVYVDHYEALLDRLSSPRP